MNGSPAPARLAPSKSMQTCQKLLNQYEGIGREARMSFSCPLQALSVMYNCDQFLIGSTRPIFQILSRMVDFSLLSGKINTNKLKADQPCLSTYLYEPLSL